MPETDYITIRLAALEHEVLYGSFCLHFVNVDLNVLRRQTTVAVL